MATAVEVDTIIARRVALKSKGFINQKLSVFLNDYKSADDSDVIKREIDLLTLIFNDYSHCHIAFLSYVHAHMNARQTLIDIQNSSTAEASAFKNMAKDTYATLSTPRSYPLFPVLFSELGKDSVVMRQVHMSEIVDKLSLGNETVKFEAWDKVVVQENARVADMFREALKKVTRLSDENKRLREENKRLSTLHEEGREDVLERVIDDRVAANLRRLLSKDDKASGRSSGNKSSTGTEGTIVGLGTAKGLATEDDDAEEREKRQITEAINTLKTMNDDTDIDQFIYDQAK